MVEAGTIGFLMDLEKYSYEEPAGFANKYNVEIEETETSPVKLQQAADSFTSSTVLPSHSSPTGFWIQKVRI